MPRKLGEVRTRDLIVLWGRAAGRCSHPECKMPLVAEATEESEAAGVGQAAHIVAPGSRGPRGGERAPGGGGAGGGWGGGGGGRAAHTVARGSGGPRGGERAPDRVHGYENLI